MYMYNDKENKYILIGNWLIYFLTSFYLLLVTIFNKRGGTRWTETCLTSLATGSNLKDSTSSQHHSNAFHEDNGLVALGNPQWMPCQGS